MALFAAGDYAGRYRIVRPIGINHRHEIYMAEAAGVDFVLKTVSPSNPHRSGVCADMRRQFSFLDASRCDLVGVSRYEEYLVWGEAPVVSMRYVEGHPVKALIQDFTWTTDQRLEFLADLGRTLDGLHQYGVVHRDVSSSNVLRVGENRSHLIDFDLSVLGPLVSDEEMSLSSGNSEFKAPEQWSEQPQDWRVDVFAFGVLAYLVLAREQPLPSSRDVDPYLRSVDSLPVAARSKRLIADCLKVSPDDRPSRCEEVVLARNP